MTIEQAATIAKLAAYAEQEDAAFESSEDDFGVLAFMTMPAKWDNERTMWSIDRDGTAHIH